MHKTSNISVVTGTTYLPRLQLCQRISFTEWILTVMATSQDMNI